MLLSKLARNKSSRPACRKSRARHTKQAHGHGSPPLLSKLACSGTNGTMPRPKFSGSTSLRSSNLAMSEYDRHARLPAQVSDYALEQRSREKLPVPSCHPDSNAPPSPTEFCQRPAQYLHSSHSALWPSRLVAHHESRRDHGSGRKTEIKAALGQNVVEPAGIIPDARGHHPAVNRMLLERREGRRDLQAASRQISSIVLERRRGYLK